MDTMIIGKVVTALEKADELEQKLDNIIYEGNDPPTLDVLKEARDVISELNILLRRMRIF